VEGEALGSSPSTIKKKKGKKKMWYGLTFTLISYFQHISLSNDFFVFGVEDETQDLCMQAYALPPSSTPASNPFLNREAYKLEWPL
jgi:hypothetical protein